MDKDYHENFDENIVDEELNKRSIHHVKMTRKVVVILFSTIFTLSILIADPHRAFNLLVTSRLIQVLFVLSFLSIFLYKRSGKTSSKWVHEIIDTASIIQVFLLLFTIVNFQFISFSSVYGDSMQPSFHEDETILISHTNTNYQRFDVVVIEMEEDIYYIKRIIGLPGDFIEIKNNRVYVNGSVLEEPFLVDDDGSLIHQTTCLNNVYCEVLVGEGEYFVLGDNREQSKDSRFFGTIEHTQIEGKVVYQFDTLID